MMTNMQADKSGTTIKDYYTLGLPMLYIGLGIAAIAMLVTGLYEYFF